MKTTIERRARQVASKLWSGLGLVVLSARDRDEILRTAPQLRHLFRLREEVARARGRLPHGAIDYLRFDNPRLLELKARYAGHPASEHVQWRSEDIKRGVDLPFFRGDNLYVFQSRRYSAFTVYASAAYASMIDQLRLLDRLDEDDYFGAELFEFHTKPVSRDLIDSIIEINFLERYLGLSRLASFNVMDIGAGYGRLAHRMTATFPQLDTYYCIDAVPESTFISEYYCGFRQLNSARVVALDELNRDCTGPIELAINVHSFQECKASVVAWWLGLLHNRRIPWLFVVTGSNLGLTGYEGNGRRKDLGGVIQDAGYRLFVHEHKFEAASPLRELGVYPADYYLFRGDWQSDRA